MSNFDNAKDKLIGKAKEVIGDLTDNEKTENEGEGQQTAADAKDKASDFADQAKDKANEVLGNLKND